MVKRSREEDSLEPSELDSTSSESTLSSSNTSQPKHVHLDSSTSVASEVICCSLPPHKESLSFSTYEDYEVHYKQFHVNRCSECGKNFPSELFLTRHIEENHDPLSEAKRERGEKTFGCFVEGCERRCSTPQKRRRHLIDKHLFPRTYNFYIINDGIDRHSSLLRPSPTYHRRVSVSRSTKYETRQQRRWSSEPMNSNLKAVPAAAEPPLAQTLDVKGPKTHESNHKSLTNLGAMDLDGPQRADVQDGVADLTNSLSALKFIPTSVILRQERGKNKMALKTTG
ncbi:hypothetical protein PRK78_002043 [Emydomyces testavorans]|uniref:C2H2-type domain-containing protein n=1 Tax=Emydomyces testavorans TaxID=2070801 RepID=A0AAF0DDH5_9EURO|nr:hypothetical protein PRK78_002043 [Emydomyces testavorans]